MAGDVPFLREMLYEAAHHRSFSDPAISRYIERWGRPGDTSVVAFDPEDGRKVGAAWYRLMPPEEPGYGFVDASTPEVVIAVVPDRRGMGVGRALLRGLLETARERGFAALSLSVRRSNPAAVALYEKSGFVELFPVEGSLTMKTDLAAPGKDKEPRRREKTPVPDKPRD